MAVKEVLLLGNPKLYEASAPVQKEELAGLRGVVDDLHDTLLDFRSRYGAGRAIAAPQIGVFKRLLYLQIDKPVVFINPALEFPDEERMTIWDDCLCFPDLLVKVERYRRCVIRFLDLNWEPGEMRLEGDLAELLQHEYDHLDGILATMRALDGKSLAWRSQRGLLD
jgi:peptide deformylase